MKCLTKFEIASMIEQLPGNVSWSKNSMATLFVDFSTRSELVERYNDLIKTRDLISKGYQTIS